MAVKSFIVQASSVKVRNVLYLSLRYSPYPQILDLARNSATKENFLIALNASVNVIYKLARQAFQAKPKFAIKARA
jgi:hypothetical protein